MGCVHGQESDGFFQGPEKVNPVLLGGSPSRSAKAKDGVFLEDALELLPLDTAVTFCPYFKIEADQRQEWIACASNLSSLAEGAPCCVFHRLSYGQEQDLAHVCETFLDAESLLSHLVAARSIFEQLLGFSTLERAEVHGPRTELQKVRREPSALGAFEMDCNLFELRPDSLRRPGEDGTVVSVEHYFHVAPKDLPIFKCYHCAAFSEMAGRAPGLHRHSLSFSDGIARLSEDFTDSDAAIQHLEEVSAAHQQAMQHSEDFAMEIHGPEKELEKFRGWLAMRSAKMIEEQDSNAIVGAECSAQEAALPTPATKEAVAGLLAKATLFDLGGRMTTAPPTRTSPKKVSPKKVSFAQVLVEGEQPAVVQFNMDTTVAFSLHFRLEAEEKEEWALLSEAMCKAAEQQETVLYYGVGHSEGMSSIQAGFHDAASLLMHLQECEEALESMKELSELERVQLSAPKAELNKFRKAGVWAEEARLLELAPDGLRSDRSHFGPDFVLCLNYSFDVREQEQAAFRRTHCSAFREMARASRGLEHYGISCSAQALELRQSFTDCPAALAHLQSVVEHMSLTLECEARPKLEVWAQGKELEKLQAWMHSAATRKLEERSEVALQLLQAASVSRLSGSAFRRSFAARSTRLALASTPSPSRAR